MPAGPQKASRSSSSIASNTDNPVAITSSLSAAPARTNTSPTLTRRPSSTCPAVASLAPFVARFFMTVILLWFPPPYSMGARIAVNFQRRLGQGPGAFSGRKTGRPGGWVFLPRSLRRDGALNRALRERRRARRPAATTLRMVEPPFRWRVQAAGRLDVMSVRRWREKALGPRLGPEAAAPTPRLTLDAVPPTLHRVSSASPRLRFCTASLLDLR